MSSRLFRLCFITAIFIAFTLPSAAQAQEAEKPVFKEVSVHDPSVIQTDGTFYVFGSHLASAKSKNLMQWQQLTTSVTNKNPLIPNVYEELKETFEWAQSDTLWAADVTQLADGKYYMYYNACRGDSPRSAMGVAVADNIEGPYKNKSVFLKSGMEGTSNDGTPYDATKHPNVVDPHTFFDKSGKLWMVYGSYSGGIFILEMNSKTGFPLPGQGYGKKLLGGNHSRIEGPYILYNPDTKYYYLYLSYGGLDATGGYNIRVARSKKPDGPYYDAEGNPMIDVRGKEGTFFDDRSIEPYGVKLMGSYSFETETEKGAGYVSPGHNSAYYDQKTGRSYLIFHTRFPDRGEEHEVRVHQMFMNKDGWPVVAPYRYAGETLKKVKQKDITGTYKLIQHGKDISANIKKTINIQLNKNHTISGEMTGTWEKTGKNETEITLDGVKYDGVFVRQWDSVREKNVMTFSVLSGNGEAVWGSGM
ncbi:glycoside hydrolase family 43 protein [Bacillus atrophaeus]|uniref:glycoside hydrolase family 43 protein n=1 Tax=Bacillus atrophaeus TaxID=1452 RepID=UPI002282147C|nr:glycoside hydrolase family 43 protein [Bacillus atrophaeus]MCY8826009.1 glycoside hydrolase family 43 protein [Bacillus atrophaeus]MCY8840382.1 glycoside hydrolase family 43 protein [Bacillus atrophaeus]MEC0803531.1 glycoside hydrolase family 43 protein [Bacillus atrophaeus]MEC0854274.1 glycoside hydrolase family 43 protein [Bacillus atrophaeus]MEC0857476.1 glycoside hydrolase family 43 protein [Bacillus atrophaeus]